MSQRPQLLAARAPLAPRPGRAAAAAVGLVTPQLVEQQLRAQRVSAVSPMVALAAMAQQQQESRETPEAVAVAVAATRLQHPAQEALADEEK